MNEFRIGHITERGQMKWKNEEKQNIDIQLIKAFKM